MKQFFIIISFIGIAFLNPVNAQDAPVDRCRFRFDTLIDILLNRDSSCYDAPNINSGGTIGGQPSPSGPVPTADPSGGPTYDPTSLFNNADLTYPEEINSVARRCAVNKTYYQSAATVTQVPWEILAGIHYREGGCSNNNSSVGGRQIGAVEPDVRSCGPSTQPGQPIPVPGGCGFRNLYDSLIYTGNHLKAKNGDEPPATFQALVTALSKYNGGGNSNCRGGTPYTHCPAQFQGEDDVYPMNRFDERHTPMYLRYCADYTLCDPPRIYTGLGALTVASAINKLSL
ncbi:MAG: hypothetical protein ACEQSA_04185 [Weeksellaceae bacterium]